MSCMLGSIVTYSSTGYALYHCIARDSHPSSVLCNVVALVSSVALSFAKVSSLNPCNPPYEISITTSVVPANEKPEAQRGKDTWPRLLRWKIAEL